MRSAVVFAAGLLVGALVASTVGVFGDDAAEAAESDATPAETALAAVERTDLVLTEQTVATLEFTEQTTVTAPAAGTVTTGVADGSTLEAGSVVATVDGSPVVALYGDVPTWRDLESGIDDGVDVYQLELNLALLGFDPDGELEIDQTFDTATAGAIERWQESLGLEPDGAVPQGLVTFVPGRILVEGSGATIGSAVGQGSALATGRVLERVLLVPSTSDADGAITELAATGTEVVDGTVLFVDAGSPVVAIQGDQAALPLLERDLAVGVTDGADVRLLEVMLEAEGFDADGELTVDDAYDAATSRAVAAWYESLGLLDADADHDDVTVPAGSFVVVPGDRAVGEALVVEGTDPGLETPVVALTSPARLVTTSAPLGDDTFTLGAEMTIDYPDGSDAVGVVTDVGTTAVNAAGEPGATPTVEIQITPTTIPESVAGFVEIPVTLTVVTDTVLDVFVVPTSALIALAEGGYALELVDDNGASRLIGVDVGTFQDGFVEVSGPDLAEGLAVAVPA